MPPGNTEKTARQRRRLAFIWPFGFVLATAGHERLRYPPERVFIG